MLSTQTRFSLLAFMSPSSRFKRALVTLLLELARVYGLTLNLNRESQDDAVKAGFRKVMLRAHPDKAGGSEASTKRLNAAWEDWTKARNTKGKPPAESTPAAGGGMCRVPASAKKKKEFRIHGQAAMLTYQGLKGSCVPKTSLTFVRVARCWARLLTR